MAIAFVQSKSQIGNGTLALAFDAGNISGNAIIVAVAALVNGQTYNVSDSQNNTYGHLASFLDSSGGCEIQIFYGLSIKAGANTVTFTPGASVASAIAIHEFTGLSAFDTSATASGTGNSQDSGAATINFASELLFGFTAGTVSGSIFSLTNGAGWTLAERSLAGTATVNFLTEWQIVSSIGPYDATSISSISKGSTFNWGTAIAAFAGAAGPSHLQMTTGIGA